MIIAAMPAHNEEQLIAKTIVKAQKYVDKVVVVDDGSSDSTIEIAEALGAIVVRHPVNKGYGGALQTIFKTAREMDVDELVIIDADGQHNPDEIPKLLSPLRKGFDLVIGSRFLEKSENGNKIPAYRKVGMAVLDNATNIAGDIKVSDSQSGYRAYGKRAIQNIKLSGNGMSAGSEILFQAKDHNLKLAEVPIVVRYDLENTSSQNPVTHGLSVLSNIISFVSYKRPIIFFGIPGAIMALIGLASGIYILSEYVRTAAFHYILFMVSIAFLGFGMVLITSGLILNSLVRLMNSKE